MTPYALLALIGRLVSVAAGVGTLLAIYACGARAFGRRAGVLAAAMFAVVTPFVYYAKTANLDVPYLFWFALSMVCYLRLLDGLALRDFIGLAACATLAICTKDQAYGLYLLMPLAIVHRMWQANREAGERHPLWRALFDRRLRWAAIVALVLFACVHNVAFNARGFWEHVRFITGGKRDLPRLRAEPRWTDRAVPADRGHHPHGLGWPMFLVSVAGIVGRTGHAVASPGRAMARLARRVVLPGPSSTSCSTTTTASCCRSAWCCRCFGGLAFDRWLAGHRGRTWRVAGAAAVFACTVMYATLVDVVMLRDSRYAVEQWLASRVGPGELIGFVFPRAVLPQARTLQQRRDLCRCRSCRTTSRRISS